MSPRTIPLNRYYAEQAVHSMCIVFTIAGFILFLRHQQRSKCLGVLLVHIATYIFYSLGSLFVSSLTLIQQHWILPEHIDHNTVNFWKTNVYLLGRFVASISGAFLALDRLLIVTVPLRYRSLEVTSKLSIVTVVIQIVGVCIAVLGNVNDKLMHQNIFSSPFLYIARLLSCIGNVFSFMAYSEVILYFAFCVSYWRYSRRQTNAAAASRIMRVW
uniref:G protein-coupled receptor n=1 Tax=Steinernema glaseri TaxID=37863 RepID=A0A1I8A974_9BILA